MPNHPECNGGWAVVKKDGGKVVGCHGKDKGKAMRQLKALYANTSEDESE